MTDTDYPYDTAEAVRRAKMADQDAHHLKRLEGIRYDRYPNPVATFLARRPPSARYVLGDYKLGYK